MSEALASVVAPGLREDLRLHAGPDESVWLVYDPMAHRYHEVDRHTFRMLSLWQGSATYAELAQSMSKGLCEAISVDDVVHLAQTMDDLGLLREPLRGWKSIHERREKRRQSAMMWLLHNYLFIRIPLVRPDAFLQSTLPVARALASWPVLAIIGLLGLAGLYMASRQWDAFTNTFMHFFSLEGLAGYFAALIGVKLLHELGHAYAAKHFGCRVPSMGIALMVLAPMAYTDVSDAWRVKDRSARMKISAAGVAVELAIALIATFLWAFLPEGALKSGAFFVAAVSWIMSIAVNLSPLMRFDGYYLLSDYWEIPNLQARAFALMRWFLREMLFDIGAECPEEWPAAKRAKVLAYAVAATVYRLILFIGIALLVYFATLKILGIVLFAVEILWFIARPVASEMKVWWQLRGAIVQRRRYRLTAAMAVASVAAFAIPWPHRVELPAVLEARAAQRITVPIGAQVVEANIAIGKPVKAGEVLAVLTAPRLNADIQKVETQLELARLRYARRASDAQDRDATNVLERDITGLVDRLDGLTKVRADLVIRAEADGIVSDALPDLHAGRWVARGDELALIAAGAQMQVRGYIPETLIRAIKEGASGMFISELPLADMQPVQLAAIAPSSVAAIELPYLTSTHGGPIAVNEDKDRGPVPVEAQYQVVLDLAHAGHHSMTRRGVVLIEATPESLLTRIGKRAMAILIRESGF